MLDQPIDVTVRQSVVAPTKGARQAGLTITAQGEADFAPKAIRNAVGTMLRLNEDLGPFWRVCRKTPRLKWVARRGAGRLMRSPTLFEDLIKLLFTTNCN